MMGPMMAGSTGGGPALIVLMILLAVTVAVAAGLTLALRSTGPLQRRWRREPGRQQVDSQAAAQAEPGDDPLVILRERYAHGEIGHAEFTHALDHLLPIEDSSLPPARHRATSLTPGGARAPHGQGSAAANRPR